MATEHPPFALDTLYKKLSLLPPPPPQLQMTKETMYELYRGGKLLLSGATTETPSGQETLDMARRLLLALGSWWGLDHSWAGVTLGGDTRDWLDVLCL